MENAKRSLEDRIFSALIPALLVVALIGTFAAPVMYVYAVHTIARNA